MQKADIKYNSWVTYNEKFKHEYPNLEWIYWVLMESKNDIYIYYWKWTIHSFNKKYFIECNEDWTPVWEKKIEKLDFNKWLSSSQTRIVSSNEYMIEKKLNELIDVVNDLSSKIK